jgi:hypothetical protein
MVGTLQSNGDDEQSKGDKNIADSRISELKADSKRNTKNERHNFAVGLRNKKREDMINQKRR